MISKVKALTLALVAVCALGVVVASGASAAEFRIAGMGTATGDGTQVATTEFKIPEGELKCPNAIFNVHTLSNAAEVDQETSGQTATVKVEESAHGAAEKETITCSFAGLFGSLVHMNGCDFRLHSGPPIKVTVICPAGQQITITSIVVGVTKCTIHIPTQTDKQGLSITNNATDFNLTAAITGLTYQTTKGTGAGACTETTEALGNTGTNGQFQGEITVQGTAGGVASNISYS